MVGSLCMLPVIPFQTVVCFPVNILLKIRQERMKRSSKLTTLVLKMA